VTGLLYARRRSAESKSGTQPQPRAKARPKATTTPKAKATPKPKAAPKPQVGPKLQAAPKPRQKSGGDDKSKRGAADRSRVALSEPYEVTYFARKHGINAAEARDIIREAGPDRKAANALAKARKKP
jgi:hypothetical protein